MKAALLARRGAQLGLRARSWGCRHSSSSTRRAAMAPPQALTGHIPGMLQRVAEVNTGLQELSSGLGLVPFVIDGQQLGHLKPDFAQTLLAHADVFTLADAPPGQQARPVTLVAAHTGLQARSDAVAAVLQALRRDAGLFSGWRDELYPVAPSFDSQPALLLERAAAPYFGVRAYGVHVNGFVVGPDGVKRLWVARRSTTKQTWPGKLDHIVAGGQPYGLSCAANVVKECWEEAGIPAELASAARPVGCVSYVSLSNEGLKPDMLFCYDLQLPADFVPVPQDGEVEEFMLWDLRRVAATISGSQEYKPNVSLVIIDFLIRHGLLAPEEKGYLQLVSGLRVGTPA